MIYVSKFRAHLYSTIGIMVGYFLCNGSIPELIISLIINFFAINYIWNLNFNKK